VRQIAVGFALAFLAVTPAFARAEVAYGLSPVFADSGLAALEVTITLDGDADGTTTFVLPNEWGGETALYRNLRDFVAEGASLPPEPGTDSTRISLRHAPNARITLRYRVVSATAEDPVARGRNEYRPVIRPTWFHAIGYGVFARPERADSTHATFAWDDGGAPAGFVFASDLEHAQSLTLESIGHSVVVGGDFRVTERGVLRVAFRGAWPFTDASFLDRLEPIVASHHRFWGDPAEPYFVSVLPLAAPEDHRSVGGTNLGDAFAFMATANADEETLLRMLAHEHLHTWISPRLARLPDGRDEPGGYWFSEGFTDFYTFRLLVRDSLWTVEQYAKALDGVLTESALSKARAFPNAKVVADFWSDPDVQKLPYQRGFLLALAWDTQLRAKSKGRVDLDDVMLALRARTRAAGAAGPPPLVPALTEEMKRHGVDVTADLARHVERGEPILLPADACAPCGTIATDERPDFDRGFDIEKTAANDNRVTGLDPDSPAARAGLREGMELIKREAGKTGDSRVPVTYRVKDGDRERLISYRPEGKTRRTWQELKLADLGDAAARRRCADRLAGR